MSLTVMLSIIVQLSGCYRVQNRAYPSKDLVLPMRGLGYVAPVEVEVAVLGGGEVVQAGGGADGEARGLAQLEVEALRRVRVAGDALAVRVPVLAVLSWNVESDTIDSSFVS